MDDLNVGVVGVFIAPTTKLAVWWRLLSHGAPDSPVRHRTSRRAQKTELQRSELNGFGDVAGAPDMSGVHRTVRCTIRQTAHQTASLVVGAINTPNHPTFKSSKFSTFQPLTRARHSIQDTPK